MYVCVTRLRVGLRYVDLRCSRGVTLRIAARTYTVTHGCRARLRFTVTLLVAFTRTRLPARTCVRLFTLILFTGCCAGLHTVPRTLRLQFADVACTPHFAHTRFTGLLDCSCYVTVYTRTPRFTALPDCSYTRLQLRTRLQFWDAPVTPRLPLPARHSLHTHYHTRARLQTRRTHTFTLPHQFELIAVADTLHGHGALRARLRYVGAGCVTHVYHVYVVNCVTTPSLFTTYIAWTRLLY